MLDTVQSEQQNITNDLKQLGKEKTYKQKIMLDTVQQGWQNKTNDLKQQGKEKTYMQKTMLDKCSQSSRTKQMIRNDKEKRKHTSRR